MDAMSKRELFKFYLVRVVWIFIVAIVIAGVFMLGAIVSCEIYSDGNIAGLTCSDIDVVSVCKDYDGDYYLVGDNINEPVAYDALIINVSGIN